MEKLEQDNENIEYDVDEMDSPTNKIKTMGSVMNKFQSNSNSKEYKSQIKSKILSQNEQFLKQEYEQNFINCFYKTQMGNDKFIKELQLVDQESGQKFKVSEIQPNENLYAYNKQFQNANGDIQKNFQQSIYKLICCSCNEKNDLQDQLCGCILCPKCLLKESNTLYCNLCNQYKIRLNSNNQQEKNIQEVFYQFCTNEDILLVFKNIDLKKLFRFAYEGKIQRYPIKYTLKCDKCDNCQQDHQKDQFLYLSIYQFINKVNKNFISEDQINQFFHHLSKILKEFEQKCLEDIQNNKADLDAFICYKCFQASDHCQLKLQDGKVSCKNCAN